MAEPAATDVVQAAWPSQGRLGGIDFGTVRIGVAVTDPLRRMASPLETYQVRDPAADARYFHQLVRDERIVGFVVGLPVHTDGRESQKSAQARRFGAWLAETTGTPVEYYDERYTTVEAEQALLAAGLTKKKRQARLDRLAAQIMLASYLESRSKGAAPPEALDA